jgi:hypothetical protein
MATAARPSKALQPRAASRPEALLPVQLAFPPQAPRQQALRVQRVRLPVLPVPQAPRQQALRVQRVRLPVLPVPPTPRQQALQVQRVPLFRLLLVLRCLAP